MRLLLIILLMPTFGFAQRLILNNDVYINIENAAFVVIDNGNANAITTMGTGGNILSEDEDDIVKWNIGTATGDHVVPWTTNSGVKIPLSLNVTSAGVGSGSLDLSTYETIDHLNTPWASGVTNMNHNSVANELYVVDRFWVIDTTDSYTTNPTVTASFGYDPAEYAAPNTITEANLQAQRWNTTASDWEGLLFGTANTAANNVNAVAITPTAFFPVWVLTDNVSPLPVSLSHFDVLCNGTEKMIEWSTVSEINNDYFVVEKSYDGINFFDLETVQGNGNSNITQHYTVTDIDYSSVITYYRLKQVDFDGATTYFNTISKSCSDDKDLGISGYLSNGSLIIDESSESPIETEVSLYSLDGKLIFHDRLILNTGRNVLNFSEHLAKGMYILNIYNSSDSKSIKLIK